MSYCLLHEPWIPVRYPNRLGQVGLLELFGDWEGIVDICAVNPPRQLALYRFLIAVVHSAVRGPEDVATYKRLWRDDNLGEQVCAYLKQWAKRFDLRHPEQPFLQTPQIVDVVGKTAIGKAVYQDANTPLIWFKPTDTPWLSAPDAVQELLRMQSLELGGRKSDSATAGPGRWTQGRHVFPLGASLRETLLLNLTEYEPTEKGKPVWERETVCGTGESYPDGYLDWLTFCERRILLTWSGERVTYLCLATGRKIDPTANVVFDRNQAYRLTDSGWFCQPLNPQRQVWEDSEAMLHTVADKRLRPRVFEWLMRTGRFVDPQPVRILGFAHAGGTQAAKPVHWVDDVLTVPEAVLDNTEVWEKVEMALTLARDFGKIFTLFTIKKAGSQLAKGTQETLLAQMPTLQAALHNHIGQEFSTLLIQLADLDAAPEILDRWRSGLRRQAQHLASTLHTALPDYRSRAVVESTFTRAIYTVAREKTS